MSNFLLSDFAAMGQKLDRSYAARRQLLANNPKLTVAEREKRQNAAFEQWRAARAKLNADAQGAIRVATVFSTERLRQAHKSRVAKYEAAGDSAGYVRWLRSLEPSEIVRLAKQADELSEWERTQLAEHGTAVIRELEGPRPITSLNERLLADQLAEQPTEAEESARNLALAARMAAGFISQLVPATPAEPRIHNLTPEELEAEAEALAHELAVESTASFNQQRNQWRQAQGLPV